MMLNREQTALLAVIENTLWSKKVPIENVEWEQLSTLAAAQGVSWMLYPGTKHVKESIPFELQKEWRSITHSGIFYNSQLNTFQEELLTWIRKKEIRAAVLKGTSSSYYYPIPSMRPLGDIDLLVDKDNVSFIAEYLVSIGFKQSMEQHGFHVSYSRADITVEIHYRCSELPNCEGALVAVEEEKRFLDSCKFAGYDEISFPVLSESHQALMQLLHMERHMQEDGLGLRQVCDWAMFVSGSSVEHWDTTIRMLRASGLLLFAQVVTEACSRHLGLTFDHIPLLHNPNRNLSEAFMLEVFRGGCHGRADESNVGSLFTDRSLMGSKEKGLLKCVFTRMKRIAYEKWPVVRKYRFLLPLLYLYIPLKYLTRAVWGMNTKRGIVSAFRVSSKRRRLYNSLRLFEVK